MFGIGYLEIGIIAVVLVVLFGGAYLPKIARNMGKSGKELKKASIELKEVIANKNA